MYLLNVKGTKTEQEEESLCEHLLKEQMAPQLV